MHGTTTNSSETSLITLYEISKILSSSLDVEGTLRAVLNVLSSYMQMRRGVIALTEGDDMRIAAASWATRETLKKGLSGYPLAPLKQVVAASMPMVVGNAAKDPAFRAYVEDLERTETLSIIIVPIKAAEHCYGTMSIERQRDGSCQFKFESDVRYLTMVASLIAQTIRLHQSVAMDRERLIQEQHRLHKALRTQEGGKAVTGITDMVGSSSAMHRVFADVRQAAPSRSTILLRGESGTGKELVARAIHALSPRKDKPFIKVNCAALPENLLESELFGHEKGAFTGATSDRKGRFQLADGGTLFLDEIGEISLHFQAKLLRVLQEGEFERVGGSKTIKADVRLIAATNKNLEDAVLQSTFRADLYYRINVVPIFLPPLRARKEDIPRLAEHFLGRFNQENKRTLKISGEAMNIFGQCHFPGNVRELENCINRVATMADSEVIRGNDLPCQHDQCLSSVLWNLESDSAPTGGLGAVQDGPPLHAPPSPPSRRARPAADAGDGSGVNGQPLTGGATTPQAARLIEAMEKAGWVQAKAARLLGLTPRQVGYALKKYNIEVKRI